MAMPDNTVSKVNDSGLTECMQTLLETFKKRNGVFPEHISTFSTCPEPVSPLEPTILRTHPPLFTLTTYLLHT